MADPFANNLSGLESPATKHFAITPADTDLPIVTRALYVNASGTLVIRDSFGIDISYEVVFGQILPFRAVQVRTGTTASVIGWY